MCFCESDAVKALIHVKARKHYPGIRFHEGALARVALQFDLNTTSAVQALSEADLRRLALALLGRLPADHAPGGRPDAAA